MKIKNYYKNFIKGEYERIFGKVDIQPYLDKISSLEAEIKALKGKRNAPRHTGNITYDEINKILAPITENLFLSDSVFKLTSKEEAERFTEETKLKYEKYEEEKFDCDNFSFALMGYWSQALESFAFGIAWSKNHAFNILIDDKKQIWIVEPQTNEYYKFGDIKKLKLYYPIRLILL